MQQKSETENTFWKDVFSTYLEYILSSLGYLYPDALRNCQSTYQNFAASLLNYKSSAFY